MAPNALLKGHLLPSNDRLVHCRKAKTADLHPLTGARVCVSISFHPRVFCESENGCVRLSAPLAHSLARLFHRHSHVAPRGTYSISPRPFGILLPFEHTREDFLQVCRFGEHIDEATGWLTGCSRKLTMQSRLHGNGPSGGGESNSHTLLSASAIKTRQAMVVANHQQQQQQHAQKQQSSHSVVLKVRPGGNNIHPSNQSVIVTRSSSPQRATPEGIAIGTLSTVVFHCNNDPMVSAASLLFLPLCSRMNNIDVRRSLTARIRFHRSMGRSSAL